MTTSERPDPALLRAVLRSYAFEVDPSLAIGHPILHAALAVWREACRGRALPARADIDPLRIPREALPHILLIDVEREPRARFRWRLIGTHVTGMLGRDATGRYFDELYDPESAAVLLTGPRWAMQHRRPVRTLGSASFLGKPFIRSENLDMPLSGDGERVDMIMVATVLER